MGTLDWNTRGWWALGYMKSQQSIQEWALAWAQEDQGSNPSSAMKQIGCSWINCSQTLFHRVVVKIRMGGQEVMGDHTCVYPLWKKENRKEEINHTRTLQKKKKKKSAAHHKVHPLCILAAFFFCNGSEAEAAAHNECKPKCLCFIATNHLCKQCLISVFCSLLEFLFDSSHP